MSSVEKRKQYLKSLLERLDQELKQNQSLNLSFDQVYKLVDIARVKARLDELENIYCDANGCLETNLTDEIEPKQ